MYLKIVFRSNHYKSWDINIKLYFKFIDIRKCLLDMEFKILQDLIKKTFRKFNRKR